MNNTLESAAALIQLQAQLNGQIIELSWHLSGRREITETTTECDVRRYGKKSIFEVCVEVETNDATVILFWLEFGCEGGRWHVKASISQTLREGQDPIEKYPDASPASLEELEATAAQACAWLVNRGKEFDFAKLK